MNLAGCASASGPKNNIGLGNKFTLLYWAGFKLLDGHTGQYPF